MARIHCRLRNVLICVCSPCILVGLLFVYASIIMCITLNKDASSGIFFSPSPFFVAPGADSRDNFSSFPQIFWETRSPFWNQLQKTIDQNFNPLLRPSRAEELSGRIQRDDSILQQSFAQVSGAGHMRDTFEKLPKHMQQYARYMHNRDYRVLIQPGVECGAKGEEERQAPLILFAIKSSELNIKNRQAIRHTWGRAGWVEGHRNKRDPQVVGGHVRRVFLLGKENSPLSGPVLSDLLEAESRRYGDILQWDFDDTFFNLTLKDVLFWSWFSKHCGEVRFVFKGDDDVFVNTPRLITYLRGELRKPRARIAMRDFMVGDVIGDALPIRTATSKYFVPKDFYKGMYPMYAGGGGVVYSGLLARRLHAISKTVHLYPIDDVFVGMCLIRLDVLPVHHPAFLTFDFPAKEGKEPCSYHSALLVHKRSPEQLLKLWADLDLTRSLCRDVPLRTASRKKKPCSDRAATPGRCSSV